MLIRLGASICWTCDAVDVPNGGQCDGFHLSLRVDVDETIKIEADRQETTWASIYVRLRGGGLPGPQSVTIPSGSTIVASCEKMMVHSGLACVRM